MAKTQIGRTSVTRITFTYDDKTVLAALNQLTRNFTPAGMRPVMMEIGEELAESTRRRFATATAPDGSPWKPLASGTVLARHREMIDRWDAMRSDMAARRKSFYKKDGSLNKRGQQRIGKFRTADDKPLNATGELSRSIRYQVTGGGAGVEIGTNRMYAATHQFGATIRPKTKKALAIPVGEDDLRLVKKVTIPARPFLGLSAQDKTTVLDILRHFIEQELPS
jgi:phage gpG-like protein